MAARRALRLAERQARALRPLPRPPQRIGQWREAQGLSPSPAGPGPLRDLPDWSFADGRPSPPWRGQQRRERERRDTAVNRPRPRRRLRPLPATEALLMEIYANEMQIKPIASPRTGIGGYWGGLGVALAPPTLLLWRFMQMRCKFKWGFIHANGDWGLLVHTGRGWGVALAPPHLICMQMYANLCKLEVG
ncbi:39S ribosomal protein L52, mitochondrial isoform X1 [Motacilla alba alba]|uniref:39S ribosomal protein L52, mitochondrial isoform X1 n=1 Tax=Motacilla alba alba TaxID=1094192 RepID=UPI0018D588A5|nr:39S ribosomal protein L52, mitochondrial isoform X1 [Motacilla alba alba]